MCTRNLPIPVSLVRFCFVAVMLSVASPLWAKSPLQGADDFKSSLAAINQPSVTATVSFLASDEMAGRDTPSPELTIAGAYVASRFQAAGLKGLGDDGTFYQSTEVAVVSVPQEGIQIRQDDQPVKVLGMLSAGSDPYIFEGNVTMIADDTPRDARYEGPVCIEAGPFTDRRSQSNFFRQLTRLRQSGATAILVQVEPDHPLVGRAAGAAQPKLVNPRGGAAGPVVLIAKSKMDGDFKMGLPPQSGGSETVRNVVGILPGSDPELAKEAIIFTAHLDHIGTLATGDDTINNGADDDATGVTGVLTLADAYAALPTAPKRSVIFMTYWGEEKGLLGSRYWAKNPTWPLKDIVANINIEMIGRPEPGGNEKCWVTGWEKSDLGKLMNQGSESVGILIFNHPKFSSMLYRSSDNYSLAEKGVIAHSFSAGSLHDDYHQPSDEWEKLELKHMTRVIQGLFAGSLPIANGEQTPVEMKE